MSIDFRGARWTVTVVLYTVEQGLDVVVVVVVVVVVTVVVET